MTESNIRYEILKLLKAGGADFVSGREIGDSLSITRSAVWKQIARLERDGYAIEASPKRGYKLVGQPDRLSAGAIGAGLETAVIGQKIIYLDETPSTNSAAKNIASNGAPDGTVVVAERQTAGRGRLGRQWLPGGDGDAIYLSVILRPEITASSAMIYTLAAGTAACKAIRRAIGKAGGDAGRVGIKWPNDILIGGRKVCGILTELSAEEDKVEHIIAGIGINANQAHFSDEIALTATSVFLETGVRTDRCAIINDLLNETDKIYPVDPYDHSALLAEYRSMCVNIGRFVQAHGPAGQISGECSGISENGELLIKTADGAVVPVRFGEVSVRGMLGYI